MLDQNRFFVDEDIKKAYTLPPEAYSSKEFLELELQTIFKNSWLCVPRLSGSEIEKNGAGVPFEFLGKPLFLQKDFRGSLRCFPNVCTHKWHTLVSKPSIHKNISCPYHGRSFSLDGKFVSQTGAKTAENFPSACDNLLEFKVAKWWKLFFVSLGKPKNGPEEILKEIKTSLAKLPLEKAKRKPHKKDVRMLHGNFLQHADNYLDYFHTLFIHAKKGGLADKIDFNSYQNGVEFYPDSCLQWCYAKNQKHGFDPSFLPDKFRDPKGEKRVYALWWFLPPNLTINVWPWGISINVYEPSAEDPLETRFWWQHYAWDEKKYKLSNKIWLNDEVDKEDVEAVKEVKSGIESGFAQRGRFMPGYENVSHWFHRWIYKKMFEQ